MRGFELITKILAKNNSIKSINVENLTEIDLSGNRLELSSSDVIKKFGEMKMLRKLMLGGNPWICDDPFFDFIRFNMYKVDYESIFCNDGEPLYLKHNRLIFWITNDARAGMRANECMKKNAIVRNISHSEALGVICPSKFNCIVMNMNATIIYDCPVNAYTNILSHFNLT